MELPLWKIVKFAFFVNRCSRSLERLISCAERQQTLFLDLFLINTKDEKKTFFLPKSWSNPFGKILILRFSKIHAFVRTVCLVLKYPLYFYNTGTSIV